MSLNQCTKCTDIYVSTMVVYLPLMPAIILQPDLKIMSKSAPNIEWLEVDLYSGTLSSIFVKICHITL